MPQANDKKSSMASVPEHTRKCFHVASSVPSQECPEHGDMPPAQRYYVLLLVCVLRGAGRGDEALSSMASVPRLRPTFASKADTGAQWDVSVG